MSAFQMIASITVGESLIIALQVVIFVLLWRK